MYLPELTEEEFVRKHEKLVYKICTRFYGELEHIKNNTGFELEDLTQMGLIALLDARRCFDVKMGYAFSTYLYPKVWGTIKNNIDKYNIIKVSRTVKRINLDIYLKELDLTIEEIMNIYNVNYTIAYEVLNLYKIRSLDEPININDDTESEKGLYEILPTNEPDNIFNLYLTEFSKTLSTRESIIFKSYFLNDVTQDVLALTLGTSQAHICRLVKKLRVKFKDYYNQNR